MSNYDYAQRSRRRYDDGWVATAVKWAAGVLSALITSLVVWLFATVLELHNQIIVLQWYLKYRGIVP